MGLSSAVNYHDALAAEWDQRYAKGGFRRRANFIVQTILPLLEPLGAEWLDVGCGTGFFSRVLARRGATVTGIDGSGEMIGAGVALAERDGVQHAIQFREVDGLDRLDFEDSSFDGCICFSVVEYLDQPDNCLDEIARVLKSGGYFVGSFPNSQSLLRRAQLLLRANGRSTAQYLQTSSHSWSSVELSRWICMRGFNILLNRGFDPVLPSKIFPALFPPSLHFILSRKR